MGGAGWARLGQIKGNSTHHWLVGTIKANQQRMGVATWDGRATFDAPLMVMQRYMDVGMAGIVRRAQAAGQIIVNDVDDWFWGIHRSNQAFDAMQPDLSPKSNISHYRETLLASDVVVVSTPFLADRITEWGAARVELIRNGVNVKNFPERRHRKARPVVGWAGSTAHRSGDLKILRKPFADLDGVTFHHTGAYEKYPSFAAEVGIDRQLLETMPMLAPHEYPYGMAFDIGVVPLVDIDFNRAKSNIKGLEYAACGIPFIASPLPEYQWLAEEQGIGRLAKTARDWRMHLDALIDYDTRREEGVRMRNIVKKQFTAKAQARQWDELIWDLLE